MVILTRLVDNNFKKRKGRRRIAQKEIINNWKKWKGRIQISNRNKT
jgi:hypothetical protein